MTHDDSAAEAVLRWREICATSEFGDDAEEAHRFAGFRMEIT